MATTTTATTTTLASLLCPSPIFPWPPSPCAPVSPTTYSSALAHAAVRRPPGRQVYSRNLACYVYEFLVDFGNA
eukprot:7515805-Pyramimonas_sp.AAC.1